MEASIKLHERGQDRFKRQIYKKNPFELERRGND